MKRKGNQEVTLGEYVKAICYQFRGWKDPLEKLNDFRQIEDLEGYIKDFDVLWNKTEISDNQVLIFFLRGLKVEIKNLVKMFGPKILNQAYNLASLQDNTPACRRFHQNYIKFILLNTNQTTQSKPNNNQTPYKLSPTMNTSNLK